MRTSLGCHLLCSWECLLSQKALSSKQRKREGKSLNLSAAGNYSKKKKQVRHLLGVNDRLGWSRSQVDAKEKQGLQLVGKGEPPGGLHAKRSAGSWRHRGELPDT
ncbi:hypothetical protein GOP47_0010894 [Adiantum capillus-veneris]|uniref:Uncharacterized protein n=1 Tax=Adiantum capillus-veneris TaxID=13818 RepID=A0A9D4ZGT1_ADICA|nr:hypothetical protein GOP47_0010894 [Adiantum capillus-veneris]